MTGNSSTASPTASIEAGCPREAWHELHVRDVRRVDGKQSTANIRVEIVEGGRWPPELGVRIRLRLNQPGIDLRQAAPSERGRTPNEWMCPEAASEVRTAYLSPMSGLAANRGAAGHRSDRRAGGRGPHRRSSAQPVPQRASDDSAALGRSRGSDGETLPRDVVVAFVGQPHRIDNGGSQARTPRCRVSGRRTAMSTRNRRDDVPRSIQPSPAASGLTASPATTPQHCPEPRSARTR